jgi:hypothetical protein
MDGRKNNGGHSTKGYAGRKPKDAEGKLIERLDNIIESDEVIKILRDKCLNGDMRAIQLYFNYRYGKPKESIDVTSGGLNLSFKDLVKFD